MTDEVVLPGFRVAGVGAKTDVNHLDDALATLWQRWQTHTMSLPAFSQTVYCVYRYLDKQNMVLTIGKLVPNDAVLPEEAAETWLPPQHYHVWQSACADAKTVTKMRQTMQQETHQRRWHSDFEAHSPQGVKWYIGVMGEVQLNEL